MLCVWDVGVLRAQQLFGSATIFVCIATCQFIRTEDYYLLNHLKSCFPPLNTFLLNAFQLHVLCIKVFLKNWD